MNIVYVFLISLLSIGNIFAQESKKVVTGAENYSNYLNQLQNKTIAVVANQASLVGDDHLIDFLLDKNVQIDRIFSPEHGFRGVADAGEKINNDRDAKTGIEIISLYGKHYKPTYFDLRGIELMVFDLQDVGVRFYTYLSTLHYVMEVCAELEIPVLVLDRPNPNAYYIDGPVLEKDCASFVGKHPVPIVYGMTIGEYAQMINGEKWLKNGIQCKLTVVPCLQWERNDFYELPIKPSPNLPNALSVALYPSLCFFEGTIVSAGRGTNFPFQTFGHPDMSGDLLYTPRSIAGASKYPKYKGKTCGGFDLRFINLEKYRAQEQLNLSFLMTAYEQLKDKENFFNAFFKNLAGTKNLKNQLKAGLTEEQIRESWQEGIQNFKKIRKKYLIYD